MKVAQKRRRRRSEILHVQGRSATGEISAAYVPVSVSKIPQQVPLQGKGVQLDGFRGRKGDIERDREGCRRT
jgi:hypothetical protein